MIFRAVIAFLRSLGVTYGNFFDAIGPLLLGFIVGADQEFHHDSNGEELDSPQDQHHPKNEQWSVADILPKSQFYDQEVNIDQDSDQDQEHPKNPKKVDGPLEILSDKEQQHHVRDHFEDPFQSVFGYPGVAGVVFDGDLFDLGTLQMGQKGDETVHFPIEVKSLCDILGKDL